ncbi:hypothetical protein BDP27DRAFT_1430765 [Rhodocollybia butyracea]|uniref:Uncharacterized protein n=1 Tax=Rhodocollybia butyracea TaxID=206335 RepID=A0A9P5TYI5_9AGAR|nr:hypothetical protein BDP27DRAFT_1430765 [Rhodocollybia butyracea]
MRAAQMPSFWTLAAVNFLSLCTLPVQAVPNEIMPSHRAIAPSPLVLVNIAELEAFVTATAHASFLQTITTTVINSDPPLDAESRTPLENDKGVDMAVLNSSRSTAR